MIADIDAAAWSRNAFVAAAGENASTVSRGAYHRLLKLPITEDGRTCLERHRLKRRGKYAELGSAAFLEWWNTRERSPFLPPGVYFSGFHVHYHFLLDGLGTLQPVERQPDTLFVDEEMSDGQVTFLLAFARAAGLAPFARVAKLPGAAYRFESGTFYCLQPITRQVARLREVLGLDRAGAPPGGRRLFVLRNAVATRRLRNQERIAALLQSNFGFEVVDPAAMTLAEQVAAFRDAAVVMGPHGSGLANAVFAQRLALLVEIFHTDLQPFYRSLAHALGSRYVILQGERAGVDAARADNADYILEEQAVMRGLEAVLREVRGVTQP